MRFKKFHASLALSSDHFGSMRTWGFCRVRSSNPSHCRVGSPWSIIKDFMGAPRWGGDETEEEKAPPWVPTPGQTRDPLVLLSSTDKNQNI